MKSNFFSLFIFIQILLPAQNAIIKGKVLNEVTNEPLPFVNIVLQNTSYATQSDANGNYIFKELIPGLYTIEATFVGLKKKILFEIEAKANKPVVIDILMEEEVGSLDEITITASPYNKTDDSPLSLRTLGTSEIERNPGGNRDISKVIQSLPGVGSTPSFRNDIIIRGGAPSENKFYLDGLEVPNINHFATQGSSGGPVGMINVYFIREVDFLSGAFPSNRGNTLSSVFEFKQKDGNNEMMKYSATLGASDLGFSLDGPLGKKTTAIFSIRRSYLQFLFKALELPFLPTYNDYQYKLKIRITEKDEVSVIGLGALDQFVLNKEANETELQQYFLGYIPVNNQWNYTQGVVYKHFAKKSYYTLVAGRNMLFNRAYKYRNNDESDANAKILDYRSTEEENKFRIENTYVSKGFKLNTGAGYEFIEYGNETFNKKIINSLPYLFNFRSRITFNKFALFSQASKSFFNQKLTASLGVRTDFSDYSKTMINPVKQLSPRVSLSYVLNNNFSANFNAGRYFQLPSYTVLGYRNNSGELQNKEVTYIYSDHLVAGLEYVNKNNLKITMEGFYKWYGNYPFSLTDSVCLANLGADFGVIGNEPVASISKGRSYGIEFMVQQKLFKGFYGILAYTFVFSEFQDRNNNFVPSSWDNRHIVNLVAGKKFNKNWEAGAKWRLLGGAPYTPYNIAYSSLQTVWEINNAGVPDFTQLNTKRLPIVHQLDIRIDKKYYLKKWTFDFYIDIQNAYNFKTDLPPYLTVKRDAHGNPLPDPSDPAAYQTYQIANESGTVLPTIGVVIDF